MREASSWCSIPTLTSMCAGHIAIVRPSEKSARMLEENGPEIIQAGEHNHDRTNVKTGFANHRGAWPDGVLYYSHVLP